MDGNVESSAEGDDLKLEQSLEGPEIYDRWAIFTFSLLTISLLTLNMARGRLALSCASRGRCCGLPPRL